MHPKIDLNIALIVILLMGFNFAFGQGSTVWFEDGATWHYGYGEGMETRAEGYEKLEVTGDTIINSTEYKIINRTRFYSNQTIQELDNLYFRYDLMNDQVFRFLDSAEYLLYDFEAEKGDTIVVNAFDWDNEISYCHLIVDSIKVELFSDSIERSIQYCKQIDNYAYYFSGRMIEGIGSEMFFFPVNQLACDAGCADYLRCYQDSKITITSPYVGCKELFTGAESRKTFKEEFNIYPNPTKGVLYIENLGSREILYLELLDYTGKSFLISENPETIDLRIILDGMYLLKIVLSDQTVFVKKIIKINER